MGQATPPRNVGDGARGRRITGEAEARSRWVRWDGDDAAVWVSARVLAKIAGDDRW